LPDLNLTDLGHILDGVIERDPMTEKLQIHTVDHQGKSLVIDLDALLGRYAGQEVKLTLASMDNIRRIQEAIGDGEGVLGLMPEDIPGATFQRTFKP
jgi:hypothetical protein